MYGSDWEQQRLQPRAGSRPGHSSVRGHRGLCVLHRGPRAPSCPVHVSPELPGRGRQAEPLHTHPWLRSGVSATAGQQRLGWEPGGDVGTNWAGGRQGRQSPVLWAARCRRATRPAGLFGHCQAARSPGELGAEPGHGCEGQEPAAGLAAAPCRAAAGVWCPRSPPERDKEQTCRGDAACGTGRDLGAVVPPSAPPG